MATKAQIVAALDELDIDNDNHWTGDGDPRLEAVSEFLNGEKVTRAQVKDAAPHFTRTNPELAEIVDTQPTAAQPQVPTAPEAPAATAPVPEAAAGAAPTDPVPEDAAKPAEGGPELSEGERLEAEAQEMRTEIDRMKAKLSAKEQEAARAFAKEEKALDPHQDQKDRMAYIRKQQENRAARAEASKELRAALGLTHPNLAKTIGRSPIDAAMMARKPEIGATRPSFAVPTPAKVEADGTVKKEG